MATYTTNELIDAVADAREPKQPMTMLHLHIPSFTGAVTVWSPEGNEIYAVEGLPITQMLELLDDMPTDDYNIHWADSRSTTHTSKQRFSDVLEAMLGAH